MNQICPKCSNYIPEGALFCQSCGTSTQQTIFCQKCNNYKTATIIAGCVSLILLVGGLVYTFQQNGQIQSLNAKVEEKEKNVEDLQKQLEKKDEKLDNKESEIADKEKTIEDKDKEKQQVQGQLTKERKTSSSLKSDLNAISTCINGIQKLSIASQSNTLSVDYGEYEKIKSNCEKADKILEKMKSSNE